MALAGGLAVDVELPVRLPFAADHLEAFLAARAVPGIEAWDGEVFHRSLDLSHGHGVAQLRIGGIGAGPRVAARIVLEDERDLAPAVERSRRLLDLDADPVTVDEVLSGDPVLRRCVEGRPGLRMAGSVDPFETAVRAVVGQQISVSGARTVTGRIVAAAGAPLLLDAGPVTHVFPRPSALADIDPGLLPMPVSRKRTIVELARRVVSGRVVLDHGADRDAVTSDLLDVPGIGPWTAGYVRMRGLGDPDVFLPTDLGVKVGLARLGISVTHADRWRPWRSYALHHVWAAAGFPPGATGPE